MSHSINITRIKAVSNALDKLETPVVFVGGAVASLYADIDFREEARPTDDVDVVIELLAYKNYAVIEERLRTIGFENDMYSKVICRYRYQGLIVDIMPTDEKILGFSNKWYAPGFKQAVDFKIDELHTVKIFPAAYFIASKLEAFKTRGKNDGRTSSDFEDIVFLLNYRNEIWNELQQADEVVRKYLKDEFRKLLAGTYIDEWLAVHLDYNDQQRAGYIVGQLKKFISNQKN
jgi:predicted nucleotidyltransferase